jgi:hypothetical protein
MAELFTSIYTSLTNAMGFEWIAWVVLFITMFAIIAIILELDFLISLTVALLPILIFSMYNAISIGAWGISIVVLILGLVLALSMFRLIFK